MHSDSASAGKVVCAGIQRMAQATQGPELLLRQSGGLHARVILASETGDLKRG